MPQFIYSTLACDQNYTLWADSGNDMKVKDASVFVKGGAGVANDRIVTPLGVMTEVTDDEYALLQKNKDFQLHVKNGFIRVEKKAADVEKVVADMNRQDASAPKTPESPEMQRTDAEKATA